LRLFLSGCLDTHGNIPNRTLSSIKNSYLLKRFFKILGSFIVVLLLILSVALWLLSREKYQNILAQRGATYLSEKLKTKVEVKHVRFSFFNNFNLEGVYIEDNYHDTLAYIGNLQLKTTELFSNYWRGSKPVIKTVTLENVFVNLNRKKDSTWNYDFIADAFTSDRKDTVAKAQPKTTESSGNPEIDLKKLTCKNLRFYMNDGWRGEDMNFTFQSFYLNTDRIDLDGKNIELDQLVADGATIAVRQYDGYKPEDLSPDDTTEWGTPFNPGHFTIALKKFQLKNSSFLYRSGDAPSLPAEFDPKNIAISKLNISLADTRILNDTVFSSIEKLSALERCGFTIKEFNAKATLSQVHASLDQLKLVTNFSTVTDHYEMNYRNFHDFKQYITAVNMKANFKNTTISSLDLGYFANTINRYPIAINVDAEIDGTVDNIHGKNITLQTKNTFFKGNATIVGLPDLKNTIFDVTNINLSTSAKDLKELIPQIPTEEIAWNELSVIKYTGAYEGMINRFYTKGYLSTSLGNALLDLNLDLHLKQPSYIGNIETENFNLGKLIRQPSLGTISMKGKVDGSGFDLDNLNAKVDATVAHITVDGNTYSNLTINGLLAKRKFDGIFISQDPNLAINFNGKVDLNGKEPVYNFNSRFLRVDFQKLGFTKEPILATGYASLNFSGSTIDNFTGKALLRDVVIENEGKKISLEDVLMESYQLSDEKILRVSSSIIDAEMKGNFSISGLPSAVQLYLSHYLPQYIKPPANNSNQNLSFTIAMKNADSILYTLFPEYHIMSGTVLNGNLNTYTQKFSLDANILSAGYKEFAIRDLIIVGAGDYKELDLNATAGNFLYNNELIIPSFQINAVMANDTASLNVVTQSINDILGDANINLKGTALNKNLYVTILPSKITVREDTWQLYSGQELIFGPKVTITDLIVESGAQKITTNTKNSVGNDLTIDIKELDLQSFTGYLNLKKPMVTGRLSGKIDVDNFIENPLISASVYSTNEVRIDNDTLGIVNAKVSYDTKKKLLTIDPSTIIRGTDRAVVGGYVNLKDSSIHVKTNLSHTNIAFSNEFVIDYIKDLKGFASGKVNIDGPINDPDITGDLVVHDAALKVIYLGTQYYIDSLRMKFNNRKINVEDFYIRDEREGNHTALVKGYISHRNFRDIRLDLNLRSSDFLCLNTMEWDNKMFYGYIPAQMTADVKGYLDDLTLDINAKPLKGSGFHLPIGSSGDASTYDYITFLEIGKDQTELIKKKNNNYFKINMNIEATPDLEVFIILDKNTREEIVAQGNGDIALSVDMGNSMNMFGTYSITEGKYEFNFRGVLPRTFTIDEGSRIVWNGDPVDARLDVTAIYQLPNQLPLLPLISGLSNIDETEIAEARKKYDTYVSLSLKNELSSPEIKFDISQPSNKAIGTLAYDKLAQIRNVETELISQAGVLLLLGEFKSSDAIDQGAYQRGGVSTASDLISNALSNGLTNVFSEVTGLRNFTLNMNYKTYSLSNNQSNINQFNFGISANLFKDRVIVDFGSNIDVDRNNATTKGTNTVNVGGDFKAQYLITDDGRLRMNAYRTSNYNAEGNSIMKGGVGISYKKVFNTFSDFFTSKKKKNKQKTIDIPKKTDS